MLAPNNMQKQNRHLIKLPVLEMISVVCLLMSLINKNGCQPVEVVVMGGDGNQEQFTFTISSGENGACHYQLKGIGVDDDCLFAKENVRENVVKGMLSADNIQNDPEFQKIKAASCK